MSFYSNHVVPYIVDLSMRQATFSAYRRRVVPAAKGRVLEIGVGSGLNLPFYGDCVTQVIGLDPSPTLLSMARRVMKVTPGRTELLEGSADRIPLGDKSIDTVLTTWTLCSVPDVLLTLEEIRRVLRPHGRLLFVEHGRSPDRTVSLWQDRLTPTWKRFAGGCHLNRAIGLLVQNSGFRIEHLKTGYMTGPKLMTFMYEGRACST